MHLFSSGFLKLHHKQQKVEKNYSKFEKWGLPNLRSFLAISYTPLACEAHSLSAQTAGESILALLWSHTTTFRLLE